MNRITVIENLAQTTMARTIHNTEHESPTLHCHHSQRSLISSPTSARFILGSNALMTVSWGFVNGNEDIIDMNRCLTRVKCR